MAEATLENGGPDFIKCEPPGFANLQWACAIVSRHQKAYARALVMWRTAAVTIAVLGACDFAAFGGKYTQTVVQILAAIQHSFV